MEPVEPVMTDAQDSNGNPKEPEMIGPRGLEVPIGIKPTPEKRVVSSSDVTDGIDSAGTEIAEEHKYIPGPKGPDAARFVKDSYKS